MDYDVLSRQARCAALGYSPGPLDGIDGKMTREATAKATAAQKAKGLPFQHPSGLTRIHLHWTGGGHTANATDRKHYHLIVNGDGTSVRCHPDTTRLAHTLNANGGAIGVSMACMAGAVERPFSWGSAPMTQAQLVGLARAVAKLALQYDIPVTRYSIPTHAEVQPVLGIKQKQKWDITILPGMDAPGDANLIGDRIRQMILAQIGAMK